MFIFQEYISLLLEPNFRKYLDFQIVFDDNQYWLLNCHFIKREETSEKPSNYSPNCYYFVERIQYGVDLWVLLPKTEFQENEMEVRIASSIFDEY